MLQYVTLHVFVIKDALHTEYKRKVERTVNIISGLTNGLRDDDNTVQ